MLETIRNFDGSLLIKFQHLAVHDSLTPVVKIFTHLGDAGHYVDCDCSATSAF